VSELNLLKALDDRLNEFYADGFELYDYGDSRHAMGWSKDPAFFAGVVPFAQANHSGSAYMLWRADDRPDAQLPVVVFGDEGGCHVVARNVRELLRLLAFDSEIFVDWDEAYFYRYDVDADDDADDADHDHTPGHAQYVAWLDDQFRLTPADDPNGIVAAAQAEYGERFAAWVGPFLPR
jgi:hypothetical protein